MWGVIVSQPYAMPGGPAPGQPGESKKKTTVILAVVVVVLALAAALFVTLFLVERGAVADTNSQVSNTEQQISDQKKQLKDAKAEVDDLVQQGQDLQSKHDKLQACVDSTKKALQAGQTGTDQELTDAVSQMIEDCPDGEFQG
jgi:peptidoglycan hydrolase CwlO-like protein